MWCVLHSSSDRCSGPGQSPVCRIAGESLPRRRPGWRATASRVRVLPATVGETLALPTLRVGPLLLARCGRGADVAVRDTASGAEAEQLQVGGAVGAGGGEVVEHPVGDLDDVVGDELRALARRDLGMLQAALPFIDRP